VPLTEAEKIELIRLLAQRNEGETLRDFICRVTPHRPPPPHVSAIIDAIQGASRGRPIKIAISLPPRHAKTETLMNALAWWITRSPADTNAYSSYNQDQAESKSRVIRDRALSMAVRLKDDTASVVEWRTREGGGLLAGKGLTGKGVSGLMVIDDLFRDAEDASSRVERDKKWEWFNSVAMTRLEGASVVMVGTRWHKDDVIGRVIAQDDERAAEGLPREWVVINLAALAEPGDVLGRADGEALWPALYSREYLVNLRRSIGEYLFAALYQGRPRPRGATVFGRPTYYDPGAFSVAGKRIVIYADPAATKKTSGDYSVILAMAVEGYGPKRRGWVLEVDRQQRTVPKFMDDMRAFQERWGNTTAQIEAFGMAKGIPDILQATGSGGKVEGDTPPGDKFLRAQPVAAAWNDPEGSRILVPFKAPWLKDFVAEVEDFTGVNDKHDDQVDCLSGAWNSDSEPTLYIPPRKTAVNTRRV